MNEDITIRVKQVLEGNSIPVVKSTLKQLREEMDNTNRSTKEGEARYQSLSKATGELTNHFKGLSREQKGLTYEVKKSKEQMAEWGENITVIAAGVVGAYKLLSEWAKKAFDIMLKGAEFGVLYNNYVKLSGGIDKATMKLELFDKALAGNLSDDKIMRMSNSFEALGYSTMQQAQMFDMIEDASDAFNITIEEGEQKLTKYFETGQDKGGALRKIGIDTREVKKAIEDYAKSIGTTVDKLSDEEKAYLRASITMSKYGKSLEEIKNKQQDNADKLTSMTVAWDNFQKHFAKSMSDMALGNKTISITNSEIKGLGGSLGWFTGVLIEGVAASLKYFTVLSWWHTAISRVKEQLQNWGVINKPASDKWQAEVIDPKKESEINNAVQDRLIKQERDNRIKKEALKIQKEQNLTEEKALELAVRREMGLEEVKTPKIGTGITSKDNIEEVKKELNEIQKLEETLKKLQDEKTELLKTYTERQVIVLDVTDKILETEMKISNLRKEILLRPVSSELGIDKSLLGEGERKGYEGGNAFDLLMENRKKEEQERWDIMNRGLSEGLGLAVQLSDILGIGADSFIGKLLNGLQTAFGLANSFASFLSVILNIGSGGSAGIFSLIGLAGGTDNWNGGWALVGDNKGKPTPYSELAYLAPGSKVIPNKSTMDILSKINYKSLANGVGSYNTAMNPNIYIVANMDGLTFMKSNVPKYEEYKYSKLV